MSAVANEVADAGDGAAMGPDVDAPRPFAVHELPLIDPLGGRIVKENIAVAIVIEVTDAADLVPGRVCTDGGAGGPLSVCKQPDVGLVGTGIEPQHIARPVAVKVAHACHLVAGRVRANIAAAGPFAVRQGPEVDKVV